LTKRRVVVTGLGIVSPLGSSITAAWDAACNGRSGVRTLTRLDTSAFPVHIGAEVVGFNAEDYMSPKDLRRFDPFVSFGFAAGVQAFKDAGLSVTDENSARIGIAARLIQYGDADVMVAGGAESAFTPLGLGSFGQARALSTRNDEPTRASRPWDRDRDGFVMGEGAGAVILEEYEHARARGARIYAEFAGFGMSGDAFHITSPPEDGEGARLAMTAAINDAGMNPSDVDYINAHATSTELGDVAETVAIKRAFGDHAHRLAVSSTKSMTGHLLGAAGVVEAIFSILAIRDGILPPTINLENPDPACDLDYVPGSARRAPVRVALSNSFGFGGTNGSLIFRAPR